MNTIKAWRLMGIPNLFSGGGNCHFVEVGFGKIVLSGIQELATAASKILLKTMVENRKWG